MVFITYETRAARTASFMLICLIDAKAAELYEEVGMWDVGCGTGS
jgi:precorrin-6B methylase 2